MAKENNHPMIDELRLNYYIGTHSRENTDVMIFSLGTESEVMVVR
jgi:hypothetical protein